MLDWDLSINALTVKFWGVRGGVPSPGLAYEQYGGNTSCVEIIANRQRLIFDAGTGLCVLGQELTQTNACGNAHLFLSKTQWGRTQGLSFFGPAFGSENRISVYGPVAITGASVRHQLMNQLRVPYSDISLHQFQAHLEFQDLNSGQVTLIQEGTQSDVEVKVIQINADSRALGYCVSFEGIKVVYATEFEQQIVDPGQLEAFVNFIAGADLLIYGESGIEWQLRQAGGSCPSDADGPSTDVVEDASWTLKVLLQHASVQQVLVMQHAPFLSDIELQAREEAMHAWSDKICFAREGMQLSFCTAQALQTCQ